MAMISCLHIHEEAMPTVVVWFKKKQRKKDSLKVDVVASADALSQ